MFKFKTSNTCIKITIVFWPLSYLINVLTWINLYLKVFFDLILLYEMFRSYVSKLQILPHTSPLRYAQGLNTHWILYLPNNRRVFNFRASSVPSNSDYFYVILCSLKREECVKAFLSDLIDASANRQTSVVCNESNYWETSDMYFKKPRFLSVVSVIDVYKYFQWDNMAEKFSVQQAHQLSFV